MPDASSQEGALDRDHPNQRADNFPIMTLTTNDQGHIPVQPLGAILLLPELVAVGTDDLGLNDMLDTALQHPPVGPDNSAPATQDSLTERLLQEAGTRSTPTASRM